MNWVASFTSCMSDQTSPLSLPRAGVRLKVEDGRGALGWQAKARRRTQRYGNRGMDTRVLDLKMSDTFEEYRCGNLFLLFLCRYKCSFFTFCCQSFLIIFLAVLLKNKTYHMVGIKFITPLGLPLALNVLLDSCTWSRVAAESIVLVKLKMIRSLKCEI